MGSETGNEYCRGCFKSERKMMKLREIWEGKMTFSELFDSLLGAKTFDEIFQFVCEKCKIRLIDAYLFKEQCLRVERNYKHKLMEPENDNHSTFLHIDEIDIKLENENDNSSSENLGDDIELEETKPIEYSTFVSDTDNKTPEESSSIDVPVLKYSCLKCTIKFASYQEYQSHYRESHRQKHVCSECGKLVARHNLEKHHLSHSRPEHVCEACGKAFTLRENLTKHIRIHMRDQRYECEFCGMKFVHWNSKRCHVISQHTKEKKYECSYCNKKFAHSSNMLRHVRYHTGEMSHSCTFCAKEFNTTSELKNHIVTHTKEKNEICEICKKAFGTRKALRNHIKTHTGERDYECPVCRRAFTQPHVLRTHLKSHPEYPMPPPGAILSKRRQQRECITDN